MKFGKAVVKSRIASLIVAILLLIPSALGMIFTRVNYDMLNYLPDSLDTIKGQDYLLEDFDKGAFSFLIFEDMDKKDIVRTEEKIKEITKAHIILCADVSDGTDTDAGDEYRGKGSCCIVWIYNG